MNLLDDVMNNILKKDIGERINFKFECCGKNMDLNHEYNKYMCSNCGKLADNNEDEDLINKKVILNINNNGYCSRYFGKNKETDEEKHKKIVDTIHNTLFKAKLELKISTKTINDAADMMIMLRSNGPNKATIIKKDKYISTLLVCIRNCGMANGEMWEYDRELVKVFIMNNSGFSLGEKFVYDTLIKKGMYPNTIIRYDLYFIKYLSLYGLDYDDNILKKLITLLRRILYKNVAYSSNIKSKVIAIIYIYTQLKMINVDKTNYLKLLRIEKATFDTARKNILLNIYKIKLRYLI